MYKKKDIFSATSIVRLSSQTCFERREEELEDLGGREGGDGGRGEGEARD